MSNSGCKALSAKYHNSELKKAANGDWSQENFIFVKTPQDDRNNFQVIQLYLNQDYSLSVEDLVKQFPKATGLYYYNTDNCLCGVPQNQEKLFPPSSGKQSFYFTELVCSGSCWVEDFKVQISQISYFKNQIRQLEEEMKVSKDIYNNSIGQLKREVEDLKMEMKQLKESNMKKAGTLNQECKNVKFKGRTETNLDDAVSRGGDSDFFDGPWDVGDGEVLDWGEGSVTGLVKPMSGNVLSSPKSSFGCEDERGYLPNLPDYQQMTETSGGMGEWASRLPPLRTPSISPTLSMTVAGAASRGPLCKSKRRSPSAKDKHGSPATKAKHKSPAAKAKQLSRLLKFQGRLCREKGLPKSRLQMAQELKVTRIPASASVLPGSLKGNRDAEELTSGGQNMAISREERVKLSKRGEKKNGVGRSNSVNKRDYGEKRREEDECLDDKSSGGSQTWKRKKRDMISGGRFLIPGQGRKEKRFWRKEMGYDEMRHLGGLCGRCGEDHASRDCPYNKEELLCSYPPCMTKTGHTTMVCHEMMKRCRLPVCGGQRGHRACTHFREDGGTPYGWDKKAASELQKIFEEFKDYLTCDEKWIIACYV